MSEVHERIAVEGITFYDLVEYGKRNGANIVNGMPWSFKYKGFPVSHENDRCYLITLGRETLRFEPDDILYTDVNGDLFL